MMETIFVVHFRRCATRHISIHIVAKSNHEALGLKHFHTFLNYAHNISNKERGTLGDVVEDRMATAYA